MKINALGLSLLAIAASNSFVVSDEIEQCIESTETGDYISLLFELEAKRSAQDQGYWVPAFIPGLFPGVNPVNKEIPLPWFANDIPAEFGNPTDIPNVPSWPPSINITGDFDPNFSDVGHKKFGGTPVFFLSIANIDPTKPVDSEQNTLFLKNLEDRGPDNLRKKQYFNALTCDKFQYYEDKVDAAIDRILEAAADGTPILGVINQELAKNLLLDLHLGEVEGGHPDYVEEYVALQQEVLSDGRRIRTCPDPPTCTGIASIAAIKRARCLTPLVAEYYLERWNAIEQEEDKSTFLYWWNEAGIPAEAAIFEATHNALAFTQFSNTLYKAMVDKIGATVGAPGYVGITKFLPQGPFLQPLPAIDYFTKYAEAADGSERLNVVREMFRLFMVNNAWLSTVEKSPGQNDGLLSTDEDYDPSQSIFIPSIMQGLNDGYNPATGETNVATYDTSRYEGFKKKSCPSGSGTITQSDLDNSTVVPSSHQNLIPIFENAKYCPFGLGYRRCPSEIKNYFIFSKVLDKFAHFLESYDLTTINIDNAFQTGNATLIAETINEEFALLLTARGLRPDDPAFDFGVPKGLGRGPDTFIAIPNGNDAGPHPGDRNIFD